MSPKDGEMKSSFLEGAGAADREANMGLGEVRRQEGEGNRRVLRRPGGDAEGCK